MRAFFAVVLLLHAFAHLVGFLVPWRLVPAPPNAPPTMNRILGGRFTLTEGAARRLGVVWLIAGLSFAVIAIAWWRQQPWSGEALLLVVLASLVLTAVWWPTARIGLALNVGILVSLAATVYGAYRGDLAIARSNTTASVVVQTPTGHVEYASAGSGEPVLSIHGTGGGWDQGLAAARDLVPLGYHVIAPSRFGYLRTPMPQGDNSPAAEADAFAALMDELNIERVSVISFSAGTAPALQFALRYPDRVKALVLVVPAAGGIMPPAATGPPPWVMNFVLRFDLPMWLAIRYMPKTTANIVAVPHTLVETLAPEDLAAYDRTVRMLLPISARREGLLMDARNQSGGEAPYALEQVSVPTLLVSAEDDLYGTMRVARTAMRRIPDAELLGFPTGGHLLVGRQADMWPRVADFIEQAATRSRGLEPRPVHEDD